MKPDYSNELFEAKSKEKYEKLKTSFLNTTKSIKWDKEKSTKDIINYFLEEVTPIPNDPFSENLIKLLEWEYGSLAKDINEILNQIESIQQELLPTERRVSFRNKYYNFHFVTRNKHIKKQIIFDADGDICYITRYRLKLKIKYLIRSKFAKTKEEKESLERLYLGLQPEVIQKKELHIFCYSSIINIHTTDLNKYFEFYVDYYSKRLFRNFIAEYVEKGEQFVEISQNLILAEKKEFSQSIEFDVSKFTNSQIVLLTYFYLKELGLEPRVGTYVTTMIRFIHIITQTNYTKAKNSAFYKMASKAPNFKSDTNLIKDLEVIKVEFERVELPINEIQKEIYQARKNLSG
jgi:predicted small secreted protein